MQTYSYVGMGFNDPMALCKAQVKRVAADFANRIRKLVDFGGPDARARRLAPALNSRFSRENPLNRFFVLACACVQA